MSKKIEYCSLKPDFPKRAFMLFLFVLHQDSILGTVPVDAIYTTPQKAIEGVTQTVEQFTLMDQGITIPEESLLIPLQWVALFPLRKEFWTKPTIEYNSQTRMKTFAKVIENPDFYSLLVTPFSYDDKSKIWYLHAALPVNEPKNSADVEQFMLKSDHIVEPRAKYAAFYRMDEKLRFNWHTGEVKQFDNTAKKLTQAEN